MQPWNLARTNYAVVKQQSYEVAVLPLGATEPHNLHLPYGTDLFEGCLLYTSPSPRDQRGSRMPSSA